MVNTPESKSLEKCNKEKKRKIKKAGAKSSS